MKGFMDDNRSFLPMMMFFGIMDMMMFSAMFSMIGASAGDYVPADSPMRAQVTLVMQAILTLTLDFTI